MILTKKTIKYDDIGKPVLFAETGKFSRTEDGTDFDVVLKKIRNPKIHRLGFKLAEILKENMPNDAPWKEHTDYAIVKALTVASGFYTPVKLGDTIIPIPDSISFAEMDQAKHDLIIEKLIEKCSEYSGIPVHEIREDVKMFISGYRKKE